MRLISGVLLVTMILMQPALADIVSGGAIQALIPASSSIYGISPVVGMARDGRCMVVSSSAQLVGGSAFNAWIFDRLGQQMGPTINITFPAGQTAYNFDVCASSAGFMFVYDATPTSTSGNNREVFYRQYSYAGQLLSSGQVNTLTNYDESRPGCTALPGGGYAVVWVRRPLTTGTSQGIYVRRYNAAGVATDTTEVRVDATAGNYGAQDAPVIAAWPTGQLVAVWHDGTPNGLPGQSSPDNYGQAIVARFLSATLQPSSAGNLVINSFTANDQFDPRVATDDRSTCVIGWCGETTAAQVDGYCRRFTSAGQLVDFADTLLTPTNNASQFLTTVGMTSNGEAVAAWLDSTGTPGQPAPRNGFARISQQGTLIESGLVEAGGTAAETQSIPKLGVDEYGNFLCAWPVGIFVTSTQYALRVRRFARTCITAGGPNLPLGGSISLILSLPSDANRPYLMACSAGTGPLPVDTRMLRLDWDLLLNLSAFQGGAGVFLGFSGFLGAGGYSPMPAVLVPNLPALSGLTLHFAVVTGLATAPSGVNTISDTLSLPVL